MIALPTSAVGVLLHEAIQLARTADELHRLHASIWAAQTELKITDDEAEYLDGCARKRQARGSTTAPGFHRPLGKPCGRVNSRFQPRQRQRSPNRKASRDRRRMLGGSSALPNDLRHYYTEGQRAILCIVAGEVKRHGECDLPIDKLAALAGVCRTTVQTTLHEARRLGHITITERPRHGRKSLTNIVRISSRKWQTWLSRGPSAARLIGSNAATIVSTTKNIDLRKRKKELGK